VRGNLRVKPVVAVANVLVFFFGFGSPAASSWKPTSVEEFSAECAAFYASAFQIPVELVDAVIQVESAWDPYALSAKGAAGLMQLMPETARLFGVRDRFDIEENIRGGVGYLAWLIRLFHGDLRLAVAAYEVGESRILSRGLAYSSPEVFEYVSRVARVYRTLRRADVPGPATEQTREDGGGGQ
jgi:soluble lytic murein transglycosylase-like protein